ncbi:MAG: acyltransferase [Deltaproteobacteria bacterium]|nr:MAG: acyltransferase [Deltaproteobacteria bacterium]
MILEYSRRRFQRDGFRIAGQELGDVHRRCVVTAAPHTSNLDVFYTLAAFDLLGLPVRFTIKKEWLRFPVRKLLMDAGAIPIDRTPRTQNAAKPSMTEMMVRLFEEHEGDLALAVTPEGTRSPVTRWRTGFWHVARQAGVPILLGYLDYGRREAGFGGVIHPTDLEKDMRTLTRFYRDLTPRYGDRYLLDQRYVDQPDEQTG